MLITRLCIVLPVVGLGLVLGCGVGGSGGGGGTSSIAPSITIILPTSVRVGPQDTGISIGGNNFASGAQIYVNGSPRPLFDASATRIDFALLTSDTLAPGSLRVTVVNPSGAVSNAATLSVVDAPTPNPVPTITSLSPSTVAAGAAGVTITVTGTDFVPASKVSAFPTTYVNSTTLTSVVPAELLGWPETTSITVSNPAPGGGTSGTASFTVTQSSSTNLLLIPKVANDIGWDRVSGRIYFTVSDRLLRPDLGTVQSLDPSTGTLGTPLELADVDRASVSATGKYLYVANGENVTRLLLPALTTDLTVPMGSGRNATNVEVGYMASELQASPVSDETFVVERKVQPRDDPSGASMGPTIFDNAIARPDTPCTKVPSMCFPATSTQFCFDFMQWRQDGTTIYGNSSYPGSTFCTVPVTASGFGDVLQYNGPVSTTTEPRIHYEPATGLVYIDTGDIVDPATGKLAGKLAAAGVVTTDGTLGRIFVVTALSPNPFFSPCTLRIYDLHTLALISSTQLPQVVGTPTKMIRWGADGLAFATYMFDSSSEQAVGNVYLISGKVVTGP